MGRGADGLNPLSPIFATKDDLRFFAPTSRSTIPEECLRAEVEQFPEKRKSVTAQPRNSNETQIQTLGGKRLGRKRERKQTE